MDRKNITNAELIMEIVMDVNPRIAAKQPFTNYDVILSLRRSNPGREITGDLVRQMNSALVPMIDPAYRMDWETPYPHRSGDVTYGWQWHDLEAEEAARLAEAEAYADSFEDDDYDFDEDDDDLDEVPVAKTETEQVLTISAADGTQIGRVTVAISNDFWG